MKWNKTELAHRIHKSSYLKGSFKLRSGQTSSFYFDKYRFESDPEILSHIVHHLQPLIPKNIDLLAGLELGGVPLATALSLQTGIPCVFVRKKTKDYGTCSLAEGQNISEKKIIIIEDVITTGGQVCQSAQSLRKQGAIINSVICVIHRSHQPHNPQLEKAQLELKSLFTLNDFDHLS